MSTTVSAQLADTRDVIARISEWADGYPDATMAERLTEIRDLVRSYERRTYGIVTAPVRSDAPHDRIHVALNPQTEQERLIIDWLGNILEILDWDIPTLEPLADMAERAVKHGTASAYERGYSEGTQHAARGVCARCKANECNACEHPRGERLTAEGEMRRTCCCGRRFV